MEQLSKLNQTISGSVTGKVDTLEEQVRELLVMLTLNTSGNCS